MGAVGDWRERVQSFRDGVADAALWRDLDANAALASQEIERLVNYTAGDGFIYRQRAKGLIGSEAWLDAVGTGIAILFSAMIAAFLARRIVGSVAAASAFAEKIAAGDFDGELPLRSPDELGALVTSMGVMRDKLRALVEREIAERRSAQVLLADALETSPAGIVMVGASGEISIANSQAVNFFGDGQDVRKPGVALAELTGPLANAIAGATETSVETALADGRWIRVSRSVGHDGGYVAVVSDISELKRQQSRLEETNKNLDIALTNMSQGLCMFDSANKIRVVNRRVCEIFKINYDVVCFGLPYSALIELAVAAGSLGRKGAGDLLRIFHQQQDFSASAESCRLSGQRRRAQRPAPRRAGAAPSSRTAAAS